MAVDCSVSIDNTVCTYSLGVSEVCLSKLYQQCPAVHYDPESFGAAVVQMQSPRCTCLVFSSGMGVCVGARSFAEAHLGVTTMTTSFDCAVSVNFARHSSLSATLSAA